MKLIGKMVKVFLKECNESIEGYMFDHDEDSVYIQKDAGIAVAIPKCNIKYYMGSLDGPRRFEAEEPVLPQESYPQSLQVFVDGELVSEILTKEDLSTYHNGIMQIAMSNQEVHDYLSGKVQKAAQYTRGKLYIDTKDPHKNTFSMTGSAMEERFLTPTEMAQRLSSIKIKKEKPHGQ